MVREIPLGEITLRKYEKPYDSSRRELIRKVCLSLGLLQPGDSRDIIVDILMTLEDAKLSKTLLTSFEIKDKVEEQGQFKGLFTKYKEHLENLISKNDILNRNFYLVIPEKHNIDIQIQLCIKN